MRHLLRSSACSLVLVAGIFALASCTAATVTCDDSQCGAGNACVSGFGTYDEAMKSDDSLRTTECRLTCRSQSDCPFDTHCVSGGMKGSAPTNWVPTSYCVADRTAYTPAVAGEAAGGFPWGAPCAPGHAVSADPAAPLVDNPDCDTAQSFWCYATSPYDANGYCTQYQCADDGDCPGGWWCATINDTPDARVDTRKDWGSTTTVCMPRVYERDRETYCAPCKDDVDCPRVDGAPQHCVAADGAGAAEKVCATECAADSDCPLDDVCAQPNAAGAPPVCLPRAATCKGDGKFCSPCHSDADCASGGYCVRAGYSTEHFCTAPSTGTCSTTSSYNPACPAVPTAAHPPKTTTEGVACANSITVGIPPGQCYGETPAFGAGCYTYHCASPGGTCVQGSDCCSGSCSGGACQ